MASETEGVVLRHRQQVRPGSRPGLRHSRTVPVRGFIQQPYASHHSLQQTRPLPETPKSKWIQDQQHAILQRYSVELKKNLKFSGSLVLDYMEQYGVLTPTEIETIKSKSTSKDQVTIFLEFVKSKGIKAYDRFVDSLKESNEYYHSIFADFKSEALLVNFQPDFQEPIIAGFRENETEESIHSSEDEIEEIYYKPAKVEDEYDTPTFTKSLEKPLNTYEENPSYIVKKNVEVHIIKDECKLELHDVLKRLKDDQRPSSSMSTQQNNDNEHLYDVLPDERQSESMENNNISKDSQILHHRQSHIPSSNVSSASAPGKIEGVKEFLSPFVEGNKLCLPAGSTVILCKELTDVLWSGTGIKKHCLAYTVTNVLVLMQFNEIKRVGDPEGEIWYFPLKVTSAQVERLLGQTRQKGTYYVYQSTKSSRDVPYNLSVSTTEAGDVKHYHINRNEDNELYIKYENESGIKFQNIQALVDYFRFNRGHLGCRLRWSPKELENYKPSFPTSKELDETKLTVYYGKSLERFTRQNFVYKAVYNNRDFVVKTPSSFPLSKIDEDDFLSEARILDQIKHENIRQFVGVCYKDTVPYLILEDGGQSNLLQYVSENNVHKDAKLVLECFLQILKALMYLADEKFIIHRDVSAQNCLVQSDPSTGIKIQLSDFGMAVRVVQYDEYFSDHDERYCYRWAAPEVFRSARFSTKSDIWAVAVLFWELASGGKMPYGNLKKNEEVAAAVSNHSVLLPVPEASPVYKRLYKQCLHDCFSKEPEDRPSARKLFLQCRHILGSICEEGQYDPLYDVHHPSLQSLPKKSSLRSTVSRKLKQVFVKKNK